MMVCAVTIGSKRGEDECVGVVFFDGCILLLDGCSESWTIQSDKKDEVIDIFSEIIDVFVDITR